MTEQSKSKHMLIGIHQVPKSPWKFLLLAFQHVFAMFGANILVPILVNSAAGEIVIPIQVAFLCSGVGTIIYLIVTGFRTPIYLGSSFAYLGGMMTLYISTGYNVFFSLMLVGVIYVFISLIIFLTKRATSISKLLSPIIIGPAIIMIGLGLMVNAAQDANLNIDSFLGGAAITSNNIGSLWGMISISVITFTIVVIAMIFLKGIWKMIPILLGLIGGGLFAILVWGISKGVGNELLADQLFGSNNTGFQTLLNPNEWTWYPDITHMWRTNPVKEFRIEAYLAIVPLFVVTLAEHVGDHVNVGNLTGHDFIAGKPGIYRTIAGDGIATIVSAAMGGPANTSYGENTSVISVSRVASVWVIFAAAIISVIISFLAPISVLISAIPKPVMGGIEIILYSMIAINGLRILINSKVDMFEPKNIIIFAVLAVTGLGGATLIFIPSDVIGAEIALSGTGVGVIISVILNLILPKTKHESNNNALDFIDFTPLDFKKILSFRRKESNIENNKKSKEKSISKTHSQSALYENNINKHDSRISDKTKAFKMERRIHKSKKK